MKYTKGQKIYKFKLAGSGKYSTCRPAISSSEKTLLDYAVHYSLAKKEKDMVRGEKLGDCYLILNDFDGDVVYKKYKGEIQEKAKIDTALLSTFWIDAFSTISENGNIVIDGVKYSNLYGKGKNCVDVLKCNFEEFKNAELLTRRQVYNPNDPITIIKFDAPKAISVKISDIDDEFGTREIENACGFVIWAKKLKIFVAE